MVKVFKIAFFFFSFLLIESCKQTVEQSEVIAQVGSFKLTKSQLATLGSELVNDSIQLSLFIDKWAKQKAIINSQNLDGFENPKIEALVEEYRHSLLIHEFENNYLASHVQNDISEAEIDNYYKQKFSTTTNQRYLKVLLAKIPEDDPGISNFKEWWKNKNSSEIERFCNDHNHLCYLDSDKWYLKNDLESMLPKPIHKALEKGSNLIQKKDKFEYFVKTLDVSDKSETIPLESVRESIIQRILFSRKKQLLINLHDSIYKQEIEKNQVKINI